MDSSRIKYRKATEADYLGVIAISKNFLDGFDYLPSLYMKYLHDPNFMFTVGEVDGEIIFFAGGNFVDDGTAVIGISARVKSEFQKLGVFGKIKKQDDDRLSGVKTWLGATTRWDIYKKGWKRGKDVTLRMTQNMLRFHLNYDTDFKPRKRILDDMVSEVSTKDAFIQLMENDDNKWRLFPSRKVVLKHHSYELMRSNFETIWDYACKCIVTKPAAAKDPNYCLSLSLAKSYRVPKGTVYYSIDYYGRDVNDLIDHVVKHIQSAKHLIVEKDIYVCLQVPSWFDNEAMKHAVKQNISNIDFIDVAPVAYQVELPISQL